MEQAIATMLRMQHRMNTRVHPDWVSQRFAWYRAIWIECAELLEHYGYKWWKHQSPDMEQVRLEVIDIWHFGLSALFEPGTDVETLAADIAARIAGHESATTDVRAAVEALAADALISRGFAVPKFWDLLEATGLDFEALYSAYVGKNTLNFFRQDNGYKDGSYRKLWQGREDNEHLVEILAELDKGSADLAEQVYMALAHRYQASS